MEPAVILQELLPHEVDDVVCCGSEDNPTQPSFRNSFIHSGGSNAQIQISCNFNASLFFFEPTTNSSIPTYLDEFLKVKDHIC
jgi:hypothetical protein